MRILRFRSPLSGCPRQSDPVRVSASLCFEVVVGLEAHVWSGRIRRVDSATGEHKESPRLRRMHG